MKHIILLIFNFGILSALFAQPGIGLQGHIDVPISKYGEIYKPATGGSLGYVVDNDFIQYSLSIGYYTHQTKQDTFYYTDDRGGNAQISYKTQKSIPLIGTLNYKIHTGERSFLYIGIAVGFLIGNESYELDNSYSTVGSTTVGGRAFFGAHAGFGTWIGDRILIQTNTRFNTILSSIPWAERLDYHTGTKSIIDLTTTYGISVYYSFYDKEKR